MNIKGLILAFVYNIKRTFDIFTKKKRIFDIIVFNIDLTKFNMT